MAIEIGSPVWFFDTNRRVYQKDATGQNFGAPIYREHFVLGKVVGETSRSWVVKAGGVEAKLKKSDPFNNTGWHDQKSMEDDIWSNSNRHKIIGLLQYNSSVDAQTLRKIADLIGYVE